jgi:hypothetical protein
MQTDVICQTLLGAKKNDLIQIPIPSDINKHESVVVSMHSTIHTQKNTKK